MKLWEALKIYEETGRKIKPYSMDVETFFRAPEYWNLSVNEDWQVEPEPKKTVVMYQFASTRRDIPKFYWHINIGFFENEYEFRERNRLGNIWKVKRLDYTATEFEV